MPNLWDLLKNAALKRVVTTAVRHGLTALGVYLVSRGYTNESDWSSVALDVSPLIVSIVWSVLEKAHEDRLNKKSLEVAVSAPAHSLTPETAREVAKVELAQAPKS